MHQREHILKENPVPTNITPPQKLDGYIRELLQENLKKGALVQYQTLQNLQHQLSLILGPLSKVWNMIEIEKDLVLDSSEVSPEEESQVKGMCGLFEQTVTLVAQAFNTTAYYRRTNILSSVIQDQKRVKELLNEMADSFETEQEWLFGEKFEEHVSKTATSKQKSKVLFTGLQGSSSSSRGQSPFPRGPHTQRQRGRGRGSFFFARAARGGKKFFANSKSFTQHESRSPGSTRIPKSAPFGERPVFRTDTLFASNRENSILHEKLGETHIRSNYITVGKGLQNPIQSIPTANISSQIDTLNLRGGGTSRSGDSEHAGERSDRTCRISPGSIFELNISSRKEGRRPSSSNKFEGSECLYPLHSLQNGGTVFVEGNSQKRGLPLQIRSKRCLFFRSIASRIAETCTIQMERSNVPIPMSMLRSRPCSKKFYEINESSHRLNEAIECSNDSLSGRHAIDGILNRRDASSQGHLNFHFAESGVFDQHKKISVESQPDFTVFRCGSQLSRDDSVTSHGEEGQNNKAMQVSDRKTICVSQGIDSDNRQAVIICNSCVTCSPAVSWHAASTDSGTKFQGFFRHDDKIINSGKVRVEVVDSKSSSEQREIINFSSTADCNKLRCISERMGAACQDQKTGGPWTREEQKEHINFLELKAAKLAIMTFTYLYKNVKSVHIQMDSIVALTYLVKMGGTHSEKLSLLSKEIWEYLLKQGITITAEYLPGVLNQEADKESRNVRDSSEWKLKPQIFQKICSLRGTPDMDLFASRISHQVPAYRSWKLDPFSKGRDAFQTRWTHMKGYAFPPFSMIGRVLKKAQVDQANLMLITPAWQTQPWFPTALQMSIQNPIMLPQVPDLLRDPQGRHHPLAINHTLRLVAWTISGKDWLRKEFQRKLPHLSQIQDEVGQNLIMNRPGESGIAGVLGDKLIPLEVL